MKLQKYFFSLLFFSLSLNITNLAQQINKGTYYPIKSNRGFENSCFIIKDDNHFDLISFHCLGIDYGTGHYAIEEDSLTLYFETNPLENHNIEILENRKTGNDSLTILIYEEYSEETLIGSIFQFEGLKVGVVSNIDGECQFFLDSLMRKKNIIVSYTGFPPTHIPPKIFNQASKIKIRLGGVSPIPSNSIERFKIHKSYPFHFTLEVAPNYFITYKRISIKKIKNWLPQRFAEKSSFFSLK